MLDHLQHGRADGVRGSASGDRGVPQMPELDGNPRQMARLECDGVCSALDPVAPVVPAELGEPGIVPEQRLVSANDVLEYLLLNLDGNGSILPARLARPDVATSLADDVHRRLGEDGAGAILVAIVHAVQVEGVVLGLREVDFGMERRGVGRPRVIRPDPGAALLDRLEEAVGLLCRDVEACRVVVHVPEPLGLVQELGGGNELEEGGHPRRSSGRV